VSMPFAVDPALRSRLAARADIDPLVPRAPLRSADGRHAIGSLDSALARRLVDEGLLLPDSRAGTGWRLPDATDNDAALAAIARWLQANRLGGRWRDELLAVDNAEGVPVAAIERAAVRPLGIATHAVHLVGWRADGRVWIQQRALDKATDKLVRLQTALEQFKIDSVKAAHPDKDGVMKPDADAQRQISSVEFTLRIAKETLTEAISITTVF